ncbi:hypothetical protein [Rhizobium sp. SAFR-030]|uniref:hypothetical protein n=1 Tax=Rhizobium sp. SAFR-030 TaxID=3387277 RepID=UPI003F7D6B11
MNKQQEFLYIVQTVILANGINLATDPETNVKYRHVFSATGVSGLMLDAMWAKDRIPKDMTAHDAAMDFTGFMLSNLRDMEEEASGEKMVVPYWFARH